MKSLYLFIFLILSIPGTASGGGNVTLNIVPKHIEAGAGETFIISIDVDPNSNNIYSARFDLLYNQSLLEGISVEKGLFLRQDGAQTASTSEIDNGKIHYAETRAGNAGVKNPGSIAVITFRVKENAAIGIDQFTLSSVVITDAAQKELPVELNTGNFRVIGEAQVLIPQTFPERKISRELLDIMNRTGDLEKISIKISVDEKDSVQNLLNFLNSRGTEVSEINQLNNSITANVSKRLIPGISSMPFVTQITPYEEAAGIKRQPGFGIISALVMVLLIYIKKYKGEKL